VRFTVSDTGIGIPSDKLDSIFSPFTQADTTTTRKYGGTGLGLTISARLASLMGGKIWVESEVGRGTRFCFTARFEVTDKKAGAPFVAAPDALLGIRILVVDDNSTNRRILEGTLKRWDGETICVEGGQQALAELDLAHRRGRPFHVVLTDMHMPEMDGFGLAAAIRSIPALASMPIILLTSGARSRDAALCREVGIETCLGKPIRRRELLAAILASTGRRTGEIVPAKYVVSELFSKDKKLRILLAEDNRVNQAVATAILEKRGHTLVVANNGVEALSLHLQEPFDIVLMDVQMPEMDGLSATKQIRKREKGTQLHLPIIAMTAYAMKGDRERCLAAGMDGYVSKPIVVADLETAIQSALCGKSADNQERRSSNQPSGSLSDSVASWNIAETLEKLEGDEKLLWEVIAIFLEEAPNITTLSATDRVNSPPLPRSKRSFPST
jgi:CheY-like chemotaxis protein